MADIKITVEHDGVTYYGTVMRIKSTTLGAEDHGIFSAYLHCEGSGSGVSLGGYSLDTWSDDDKRRIGTAYGLDHVKMVISTAGVQSWEKLPGTDVIVLHTTPRICGATPAGFADVTADRVLIFKSHAESWKARVEAESVTA